MNSLALLCFVCLTCPLNTCAVAGGISKTDIRRFLYWAADHLGYSELRGVVAAPPSAELEPLREGQEAQTDEQDMGMTYEVSYCLASPLPLSTPPSTLLSVELESLREAKEAQTDEQDMSKTYKQAPPLSRLPVPPTPPLHLSVLARFEHQRVSKVQSRLKLMPEGRG